MITHRVLSQISNYIVIMLLLIYRFEISYDKEIENTIANILNDITIISYSPGNDVINAKYKTVSNTLSY